MKLIKSSEKSYQAASHEDPSRPGVLKKILIEKKDFFDGKAQMVNWAKLPAGNSFAAHYHQDMQEIFVIIKGNPSMEVTDQTKDKANTSKLSLEPGDTIIIDLNETHIMYNPTETDVEYIVMGIAGNKNGKTIVVNQA